MKVRFFHKTICLGVSFCLIFTQPAFTQGVAELDVSGYFRQMHAHVPFGDKLRPPQLRYFSYDTATDDYRIILDKGAMKEISETDAAEKAKTLLSYFLIGITLPNDAFWVNLRPDAADTMIDPELEKTDIGKIFLEADLQLKKDTAQYTSPKTPEGKHYWDKLYTKAGELFSAAGGSASGGGSENITIPTLTRPWIVPGEIIVRETDTSAYIYKASLKVLLEQDHLKNSPAYDFKDMRMKELNEYSSGLIRERIIPKLTKEVNTAQRYAALRQVFFSLVLSRWFKERFRGKQGAYAKLINTQNLNNLISKEQWSKNTYFSEYKESFQHGEYNIKEAVATPHGQMIRSYVSGGIELTGAASPLNNNSFRTTLETKPIISPTMFQFDGNGNKLSLKLFMGISSPLGQSDGFNNKVNRLEEMREKAQKVQNDLKDMLEELKRKITPEERTNQDTETSLDNLSKWSGLSLENADMEAMTKEIAETLRMATKYYYRDLAGILEKSGFEEQFSALILRMEEIVSLKEQIPEALNHFMVKYKEKMTEEQRNKVDELQRQERQESENKYDDFIRLCEYMVDLISQRREQTEGHAKDLLYFDLDEWISLRFRAEIKIIEIRAVEVVNEINAKFFKEVNQKEQQRDALIQDIENIHDKISADVLELINSNSDLALPSFIPSADTAGVSKDFFSVLFLENRDFNHLTQFQFLLLFSAYASGNYEVMKEKNMRKALREQSFAEALIALHKKVYDLDMRSKRFAKESSFTPDYTNALNRILREIKERSNILEDKISGNFQYALAVEMPLLKLPFASGQNDIAFIRKNLPDAIHKLDDYSKELMREYGKARDAHTRDHLFLLNVIAVSAKIEMELLMGEINGDAAASSGLSPVESKYMSQHEQYAYALEQAKLSYKWLEKSFKGDALYYQFKGKIEVDSNFFSLTLIPPQNGRRGFLIKLETQDHSVVQISVDRSNNIEVSHTNLLDGVNVRKLALDTVDVLEKGSMQYAASPLSNAAPGGIDFRAMNILTQPMGNFSGLDFTLPVLSKAELEGFDLERELAQIKKMVKAGMIPSGQRMKEYLSACFKKGQIKERERELMLCLLDICILQEQEAAETAPELREALVIVDTGRYVLQDREVISLTN